MKRPLDTKSTVRAIKFNYYQIQQLNHAIYIYNITWNETGQVIKQIYVLKVKRLLIV